MAKKDDTTTDAYEAILMPDPFNLLTLCDQDGDALGAVLTAGKRVIDAINPDELSEADVESEQELAANLFRAAETLHGETLSRFREAVELLRAAGVHRQFQSATA